jgi:hypothetical protein
VFRRRHATGEPCLNCSSWRAMGERDLVYFPRFCRLWGGRAGQGDPSHKTNRFENGLVS